MVIGPLELFGIFLLVIIVATVLSRSLRIVREWERLIILRLGKFVGIRGPGLVFLVPFVDRGLVVDMRINTIDIPKQEVITKDNVTIRIDAAVYYRVIDPEKAVLRVRDYNYAIAMLAQTTMRDVIGQLELDDVLTKRDEINRKIQNIIDSVTEPWGVKVSMVTLKAVELPEGMIRAMAHQAEAERIRRARIIEAEAERTAAKILSEAALTYESHPIALRLRELQTYVDIAKEKNVIIITESFGAKTATEAIATAFAAQKASASMSQESKEVK
uniref:Slipin family protein n=1 Tax=Ignisphaera aggregans TaxID=334771 RepID=A0A7C5US11_9CREN